MRKDKAVAIYHRFYGDIYRTYVGRTRYHLLHNIKIIAKRIGNGGPDRVICTFSDDSYRCNKICKHKFRCIMEIE